MNIKWKGPALDHSGYGCANRNFIRALYETGVNITAEAWSLSSFSPSFYGENGELVESLMNKDISYDIVINHYVPNRLEKKYEPEKINVGYSTWETNRLPEHWVTQINECLDLQLVPSRFNKRIYEKSGVSIPIRVVPHCFDVTSFANTSILEDDIFQSDRFKFLSVFQWIERKNPIGLLKAYLTEFYGHDDVLLVIKTYSLNLKDPQCKERLLSLINNLKRDMYLEDNVSPPILLITEMLNQESLKALYNSCDCFVLPTKAEGFGMPFAEACATGLPTVAPAYGGQTEFLKDPFAVLTDYQMTPVAHMFSSNYHGTMQWAEPDLIDFRKAMRNFYRIKKNIPERYGSWQEKAKNTMRKQLSYEVIGKQFKKILETLL